jgi:hypothetical protein
MRRLCRGNREGNRASRGVFPLSVLSFAATLNKCLTAIEHVGAAKVSKPLNLRSEMAVGALCRPLAIATVIAAPAR